MLLATPTSTWARHPRMLVVWMFTNLILLNLPNCLAQDAAIQDVSKIEWLYPTGDEIFYNSDVLNVVVTHPFPTPRIKRWCLDTKNNTTRILGTFDLTSGPGTLKTLITLGAEKSMPKTETECFFQITGAETGKAETREDSYSRHFRVVNWSRSATTMGLPSGAQTAAPTTSSDLRAPTATLETDSPSRGLTTGTVTAIAISVAVAVAAAGLGGLAMVYWRGRKRSDVEGLDVKNISGESTLDLRPSRNHAELEVVAVPVEMPDSRDHQHELAGSGRASGVRANAKTTRSASQKSPEGEGIVNAHMK